MNKIVLYIGIVAMVLGQSIGNDWQYFAGVYIFATCTLHYISTLLSGVESKLMQFLSGVAMYNVFKPLFEDVTKDNILEYAWFVVGIVFIIGHHVYKVIARHRTRHS